MSGLNAEKLDAWLTREDIVDRERQNATEPEPERCRRCHNLLEELFVGYLCGPCCDALARPRRQRRPIQQAAASDDSDFDLVR
jgi:hypothetical protein